MLRTYKTIVTIIILAIISPTMSAQNNTNSPYTRYGYGALADRSFGAGRAMSSIGYGLRSNKQINPMNPASYSSMDSLTFILDFGISGQMSWFSDDGGNKEMHKNGNLEYVALQFPVHRKVALSFGLLPYSYVGYLFGYHRDGANPYSQSFEGKGGLNNVYGGISFDIWRKRFSFGANVGYLFGTILHTQILQFDSEVTGANSSIRTQSLRIKDMKLDLGLQYTHPVSLKEHYTLGLIFSPGKRLNATSENINRTGTMLRDTTIISDQAFDLSSSIGIGLSYVYQNKLVLASDFLYEPWNKSKFFDASNHFRNRIRMAIGGEYITNYASKVFFSRVRYRAGIHYGTSYLQINDNGYNELGASVGLGLPMIDNRSFVNVAFEYVKIKPETRSLIDEQYFRITINYTFNEAWFYKFKVD